MTFPQASEARKSQHLLAGVGGRSIHLPQQKINKERSDEMPKGEKNHTHDGTVRPHHFMIKHDKAPFTDDKDADLRDPAMAHNLIGQVGATVPSGQINKVANIMDETQPSGILELGEFGGIDFKTWSSHSFGLANDEIKAYITLILRKVEHQHKVGNFEDSLRREQEALAQVELALARMTIPL